MAANAGFMGYPSVLPRVYFRIGEKQRTLPRRRTLGPNGVSAIPRAVGENGRVQGSTPDSPGIFLQANPATFECVVPDEEWPGAAALATSAARQAGVCCCRFGSFLFAKILTYQSFVTENAEAGQESTKQNRRTRTNQLSCSEPSSWSSGFLGLKRPDPLIAASAVAGNKRASLRPNGFRSCRCPAE
jgi:hypothetical protein